MTIEEGKNPHLFLDVRVVVGDGVPPTTIFFFLTTTSTILLYKAPVQPMYSCYASLKVQFGATSTHVPPRGV